MFGRYAVVGPPRSRTAETALRVAQLAGGDDQQIRHADALVADLPWGEATKEIAGWLDEGGALLVEGVAVARALGAWLERYPCGRPVDCVVHCTRPSATLTAGQRGIARGVQTVWRRILPELKARGVRIVEV